MKVLHNFQKFRVLCHGRTELTEVPGGYGRRCTRTLGIVAWGVQNPQRFRVRVRMRYIINRNSVTGMKVLHITSRSFGYGYECPTELTEVPGMGNTRVNARPLGGEFEWKWRI